MEFVLLSSSRWRQQSKFATINHTVHAIINAYTLKIVLEHDMIQIWHFLAMHKVISAEQQPKSKSTYLDVSSLKVQYGSQ